MPLYEYECTKCGHRFELIQKWGESCEGCPKCGSKVEKILYPAAVHYKSAGFYTTDQRGLTGTKRKPNIKVGYADKDGNPIT